MVNLFAKRELVYDIADISQERRQRMWRLTFLLSGGREPAIRVLQRILRDQRSPAELDAVHLDRLVLQHIREALGGDPLTLTEKQPANPAAALLQTLHRLRRQALEAWILSRLEGVEDVHMARAMDCSRTAAKNFLASADDVIDAQIEDVRSSLRELRKLSLDLDADSAFEAAMDRSGLAIKRRFARRTLPAIVAALLVIVLLLEFV